jgi:hypothetical protein
MTYTFKLARRLAVSRRLNMLPVLIILAACSSNDATAPEGTPADTPAGTDWSNRDLTPVAVRVTPNTVTLETNQLIQFSAHARTESGDSVGAAVTWRASGGTILPDGRFSAAAIGSFDVIGRSRVRGQLQEDTARVKVVRRQTRVVSVEITPGSASLTPGTSQQFSAIGRLANGSRVDIGVNWSATGGPIDPGGTYVAGDTAGTYRVIAANTAGTLADTASVTITAPPAPPPPPATSPPPTAVASQLILNPGSATLTASASKQFAAFGRTSAGDSVSVDVTFTATGGTITSGGLYTAGPNYGTYRVIAKSGTLADTSAVTITVPLGSNTQMGVPFGPFNAWDGLSLQPNTELFTIGLNSVSATQIVDRINAARSKGVKLLLAMTGGDHDLYKSIINGVYQFDMAKWKARMDSFNTLTIKTAVASAVADGVIIGNIVMDEPSNTSPDNSWGPANTLNKARVDSMATYAKAIFPTLPMGVTQDYSIWHDQSYHVLDFIISQYRWSKGDVTSYRDGALALGQRDGHKILFSINILDGGYSGGIYSGCPVPLTGGPGTYGIACRMTPAQVRDYGTLLGSAGCALVMWRYDYDYMANTDNKAAFRDVGNALAQLPSKSCKSR